MTTRTRSLEPGAIDATPEAIAVREVTLTSVGSMWNWTRGTRRVRTDNREDASTPRAHSAVQAVSRTFAHFGPMYPVPEGPTTEYRAEIGVTGLEGGTITAVTVGLPGLRQAFPEGVNLLLIGPSGQDELLVSAGDRQDTSVRFDMTCAESPARTLLGHEAVSTQHTSLAVLTSTVPNGFWQLRLIADVATNRVHFGGWTLTITADIPN